MESPSSKMLKKCFLCTKEFKGLGLESNADLLPESERSFLLCQVFGFPPDDPKNPKNDLRYLMFKNVCYCSDCLEIISNLSSLVSELEILKDKVSTEKRNIVDRLRNSCAKLSNNLINSPPGMLQVLRSQIVTEIDNIKPLQSCDPPNMSEVNNQRRLRSRSRSTQTENIYENPTRKQQRRSSGIFAERDSDNSSTSVNLELGFIAAAGTDNEMTRPASSASNEDQTVDEEDCSDGNLADMAVPSTMSLKQEEEKFTICHPEVPSVELSSADAELAERDSENLLAYLNSKSSSVAAATGVDNEMTLLTAQNEGTDRTENDEDLSDGVIPEIAVPTSTISSEAKAERSSLCLSEVVSLDSVDPLNIVNEHDSVHHVNSNLRTTRNKRKIETSARTDNQTIPERKAKQNNKSFGAVKKRVWPRIIYQPKQCEECGKMFWNRGTWKTHVVTQHRRNGKYKCKLCHFSCQYHVDMKRHEASRHSDIAVPSTITIPLKQEEEKFTFCHSEVPSVDIDIDNADPLSIANLGKAPDEIPEQIRKKSYICGTCDETFVDDASLEAHDSIHHSTSNSNIRITRNKRTTEKSAKTEKQTILERTTKRRKKSIHTVKKRVRTAPYYQSKKCEECGKILADQGTWKRHILRVHRGEVLTSAYYQPKKCEECGKILSHEGTWKTHILTVHRREEKYKCKLSDFSCQYAVDMKRHNTSRHSDIRSFECEVCHKNFKRKLHLEGHGRVHEGITPYRCELCSAGFNYATSLRRHQMDGDCLKKDEKKSQAKKRKRR